MNFNGSECKMYSNKFGHKVCSKFLKQALGLVIIICASVSFVQSMEDINDNNINYLSKYYRIKQNKGNVVEDQIDIKKIDSQKLSELYQYLEEHRQYERSGFDPDVYKNIFKKECPVAVQIGSMYGSDSKYVYSLLKFLQTNYSSQQIEELINKLLKENILFFCKYELEIKDKTIPMYEHYTDLFCFAWKVISHYYLLKEKRNEITYKIQNILRQFLPEICIKYEEYDNCDCQYEVLLHFITKYIEESSDKNSNYPRKIFKMIINKEKIQFKLAYD